MMPEFGSTLEEVLFEPVDEITGNRIGKELIHAIELWDNRVDIIGVEVTVNHDSQLYDVSVEYAIKGFGSSQDTLRIILKRL